MATFKAIALAAAVSTAPAESPPLNEGMATGEKETAGFVADHLQGYQPSAPVTLQDKVSKANYDVIMNAGRVMGPRAFAVEFGAREFDGLTDQDGITLYTFKGAEAIPHHFHGVSDVSYHPASGANSEYIEIVQAGGHTTQQIFPDGNSMGTCSLGAGGSQSHALDQFALRHQVAAFNTSSLIEAKGAPSQVHFAVEIIKNGEAEGLRMVLIDSDGSASERHFGSVVSLEHHPSRPAVPELGRKAEQEHCDVVYLKGGRRYHEQLFSWKMGLSGIEE
jgi:hypothetical protein